MGCRRVAFSTVLTLATSMSTMGMATETLPRGVVELFTSQGCSSCPRADSLLGELAQDPGVVALSLPIDYWDYLGWKDTLAKPRHTARQRGYAYVRADRQVYTPQVVVNGKVHVLGSDKVAIERAISETRRQNGIMTVPVKLTVAGDKVTVALPAMQIGATPAEVWLCQISKEVPIAIGRGENTGKTVTYHNVVRRWVKIGEWTGTAHTFTVAPSDYQGENVDT